MGVEGGWRGGREEEEDKDEEADCGEGVGGDSEDIEARDVLDTHGGMLEEDEDELRREIEFECEVLDVVLAGVVVEKYLPSIRS